MIVLSHSKPFLCNIWDGTDTTLRSAFMFDRAQVGSTIRGWDVNQDLVTDHDRRHKLIRDYIAGEQVNRREVANALRPMLEAFFRVAYPETFPPGTLLGPFVHLCQQRLGQANQILDANNCRATSPPHRHGGRQGETEPRQSVKLLE